MKSLYEFIQVVPGQAEGGSFRGEKTIDQRKKLPIECRQSEAVDAQTNFFVRTSLQPFHGGDVACFDVMRLVTGSDEVMWLVVRSCCVIRGGYVTMW